MGARCLELEKCKLCKMQRTQKLWRQSEVEGEDVSRFMNPVVYGLLGPLLALWCLDLIEVLKTLLSALIIAFWLIQIGGLGVGAWLWFLGVSGERTLSFNAKVFKLVPTVQAGFWFCDYLVKPEESKSE